MPFPESAPKVVATPNDQRLVPLKCVRPVIWGDDDFPGFSGTCFLACAMGHDLALTARHVLGAPNPDNMAIPISLEFGPMGVAEPACVFWYNVGAYDHVSDLAVALLSTHVDGALDLASVGFTSLETAMIVGFSKALSRVDYDIDTCGSPCCGGSACPVTVDNSGRVLDRCRLVQYLSVGPGLHRMELQHFVGSGRGLEIAGFLYRRRRRARHVRVFSSHCLGLRPPRSARRGAIGGLDVVCPCLYPVPLRTRTARRLSR